MAERRYPRLEARGGSWEEQSHVQGAVAVRAQEGLEELYIYMYLSIPISQFLPSLLSPAGIYICVSVSALQIRSSIPFLESTYNVLIYNICLMEPRENTRTWSFPPLREFTGPGGWMLEPGAQSHLDSL